MVPELSSDLLRDSPKMTRTKDIDRPDQAYLPTADQIKMIVTDVDGTLLDNDHELPQRNMRALRWIRENRPELPIVISTGKHFSSILHVRQELNLWPFPSCHINGAAVVSHDSTVFAKRPLMPHLAKALIDDIRKFSDINCYVYDFEKAYSVLSAEKGNNSWLKLLEPYGQKIDMSVSEDEVLRHIAAGKLDVYVVGLNGSGKLLDEARENLIKNHGEVVRGVKALDNCLEYNPTGVSKGTAIEIILSQIYKDIRAENVISFGDGENDVSMFEITGFSVAMCNGMKTALENAKTVSKLDNNAGGLGEVLECIFNIPDDYTCSTLPQ